MKPFISYIGTKSRFMKNLEAYFPNRIVNYYEPFVGGGSVFLYMNTYYQIGKNFINDKDNDIINAYKCLKNNPEYIISVLKELNKTKNKTKNVFYRVVDIFNENKIDKYTKSAFLVYLTKMAYNSKLNYLDGTIKPSYSIAYETANIFNEKNMMEVSKLLKKTSIHRNDYRKFLVETTPKKGDFVFFDPPYLVDNVHQYYKDTFTMSDFKELKRELDKLDKKGVSWMLTVNKNAQLAELFKKYNHNVIKKHSSISTGKYNEYELIITNY